MRDDGWLEDIMARAIKNIQSSHYDIYEYQGWTLREWQQPKKVQEYDHKTRKWITRDDGVTTRVVWGIHKSCGIRGIINITPGRAYCKYCQVDMPQDVFINMNDAMNFMKDSLEKE